MKLSEFDFHLPKELIAQYPKYPRGSSRLLYLSNKKVYDYYFHHIVNLFRKGDLLILNNSKVIPAYLIGTLEKPNNFKKKVIIYLNENLTSNQWTVFSKPGKLLKVGQTVYFQERLSAEVIAKNTLFGEILLKFNMSDKKLFSEIWKIGQMPIPPYLKREPQISDKNDYQTVFAKYHGSVAAPTAGFHFSNEILKKISNKGVDIDYITLHVGAGTFLPIKTENVNDHKMHYEKFSISPNTAKIINEKKRNKQRVICVGTTSLRTIEAAATNLNESVKAQTSETNIFITPGYKFKIVDSLITNFHTPKSTLFMLVSAFCGIQNIRNAYSHAIRKSYRFFSYGDVCWLDKVTY